MVVAVVPAELRELLRGEPPLALIDVREQGEYNAAHIPGASSLPRRLLEFRFARLVPCPDVRVVLCDDDGRRAALAARTVERMGYTRAAVLEGGLNRWASEGLPTQWGMNVPSKAFGERVEVEHHVPTIEPAELQRLLGTGRPVLILDARTPEEYQEFCIPGGRSLPGGELAYRVGELVRGSPDSTIVVNCAGRTRSIIGARILQRMGLGNVVSLKNGTAGWSLAGLPLERGADRLTLPEPSATSRAEAEAFAARLLEEDGVRRLAADELRALLDGAATGRDCVYLVDVRTESEYIAGHIPGFAWFPGGQAVQRADDLVAVRAAHVIFCCDGLVRGAVTASWFRQMGYPRVSVVAGGVTAWRALGLPLATGPDEVVPFGLAEARARVSTRSPAELQAELGPSAPRRGARRPVVLFVDTSRQFARGHVPRARWLSRSRLELEIDSWLPDLDQPVVVTDSDGRAAALAAATLADLGYRDVAILDGGMRAWLAAGQPVEQGLSGVMLPPDDVVPAGLERSAAEAIEYLRWETALVRGRGSLLEPI
jgi:rhodanese-related sulfurtransferase